MSETLSSGLSPIRTTVFLVVAVIIIILAGVGAYQYGRSAGYAAGYAKAQADIQNLQEEAAQKAAEEAAKAANPFQAVNPLQGVEANPFDKVKKVLNPFEN